MVRFLGILGGSANEMIYYAFDQKVIFFCEVVALCGGRSLCRPNIVGETRDWTSGLLAAVSSSILSTRREVQILEANILPSGDEGRIYLHDARPLNAIHLSRGRGRRDSSESEMKGARRRWRRG